VGSSSKDEGFMAEALQLAEKGAGRTRPNPLVGAVVVRAGRVVGRGWHRRVGAAHAECAALTAAGAKARGATLYVNLEPCVHEGRTPPCVPKILAAGVRRVVIAHRDPDPRVSGRGFAWLRRSGIPVTVGTLAEKARALNVGYLSAHERGRPRIALKLASSLDGRVAPAKGPARWITGPAARRAAHALRASHDTIVVGAGTVRRDNPALTVRDVPRRGPQPLRVVVSTDLALPSRARVLAAGTVVATLAPEAVPPRARRAHEVRAARLARRGIAIWFLPKGPGGVALDVLAARLAQEGRQDVLVEGGPTLAAQLADAGLVDELWLFLAPRLLGDGGRSWGFGAKPTSLGMAWQLESAVLVPLGEDFVIHGRPARQVVRRVGRRPSRRTKRS
jgi:diaminohydroxyphosphoribosylaminopyrimidine deaminase/5-amino-6-(5-phosphoribosylamino)uracil reductase